MNGIIWAVYLSAGGVFTPVDWGGMVFATQQMCENSIAAAIKSGQVILGPDTKLVCVGSLADPPSLVEGAKP